MPLNRQHDFQDGDILFESQLDAEFDNIVDNVGNINLNESIPGSWTFQNDLTVNGTCKLFGNGDLFDMVGTDHCYLNMFPEGEGAGRKAYLGFPAPGSTNVLLINQYSNGDVQLGTNSTTRLAIDENGNIRINGGTPAGGIGVIGIKNRTTAPASTPSGGGVLYAQAGALKWKGSSGTVTTIATA